MDQTLTELEPYRNNACVIACMNLKMHGETTTLIQREATMNISHLNTSILTHTALSALKNAYEKCGDQTAKELILSAYKAITLLNYDLGINDRIDMTSGSDSSYDPSEYCSAV
jgi:hypothetical protein